MKKSNSIHSIITGLTVLASLASVRGTDWPQWRGPNREDISTETGLLKQWPAGGPPVAWKITGLGAGYSGVSVDHSRIFTMGERGDSSFLFALDEANGKILWSTKIGKSGAPGWGGFAGPRGTPTVDGDRVYALGHYGDLVCAEAATGKILWQKNFVADFGGEVPEWGYAESPLVDGDQLICTPGKEKGAMAALNKMTGETLWRTTEFTEKTAYASPIVVVIDGVRQYIQVTDTTKNTASVVGVSTKGKVLWRGTFPGKTAVIPTPIYRDQQVYVSSGYGAGCALFKISKSGDAFSAEQVYANKDMENHHGGVILVGDCLYGYSEKNGWVCQDFKTGKIVWKDRKFRKGSLTCADGLLYLRDEDDKKSQGTVALVEASPQGYQEISRFDQPQRSEMHAWPHPVIANGKLYLRDQDLLLCYDVKAR